MDTFKDLYGFVEFAKNNRKYPESTANNLKSALKIFEGQLNEDEAGSLDSARDNIEEIFVDVVRNNKDKSIGSLNTYKARVIKVINDYKKYGAEPSKLQGWQPKQKKSTPLLNQKDKTDKKPDKPARNLSNSTNTPVDNNHKIEISVQANSRIVILLPKDISEKEITLRILPPGSL